MYVLVIISLYRMRGGITVLGISGQEASVKATDVLLSVAVHKNCKDWLQKRRAKDNMCLGLTVRKAVIERIGSLDIDMTGPGDFIEALVKKSVNHAIKTFLLEDMQKWLDEVRVGRTQYKDYIQTICRHFK